MLVVAPHPDDETLGCGGTIALHALAGDAIYVVVVTDGGGSRALGLGRDEMARRRSSEMAAALSWLKPSEVVQLGFAESRWTPDEMQAALREVIERLAPTLVYTTSCVDYHPEHVAVASEVARALAATGLGCCRAVRVYEVQVPLTPILANVIVDTTAVSGLKRRALEEYRTQRESFGWVRRCRGYLARLYRLRGACEVFWEVSPEQFSSLSERNGTDSVAGSGAFRGMRQQPFSDGLAWVHGLGRRKEMKRMVD